jgi:cell division protein FtsZ
MARIRVVGVGSGGKTAINGMIAGGVHGVDFLTIDTDAASLRESRAPLHIRIGKVADDIKGTGGNAERGCQAALGSIEAIGNALYGSDLVFIVTGLGGGTGSGAAPIVAQIAKRQGALVIGTVTYPFPFEGEERAIIAQRGVAQLRNWTDTLIVIPNERLLKSSGGAIGFHETYRLAQAVWRQSVQGISDLVNQSGLINVDFADVRSIVSEGGGAVIATGRASGRDRARQAAEQATHSDLLGITIDGAHGVLFNICGGADMSLQEVEQAAEIITRRVHSDANVIFGAAIDQALADEIHITVIATGFTFSSAAFDAVSGLRRRIQLEPGDRSWKLEPTPLTRSEVTINR